jgi:hypothetical protein
MTSFMLIPGAAPLVSATGASMSARGSLAVAAFSAMAAGARSTVPWVPSLCVPSSGFLRRDRANEAVPEASPDA